MNILLDRRLIMTAWLVTIILLGMAMMSGIAYASSMTTEQCMSCHSNESSPMYVDQAKIEASVHGAFGCNTCHMQITAFPHQSTAAAAAQSCKMCHADASKEYAESVHGKIFAAGNAALGCSSCHDSHNVLPTSHPDSPVNRLNVPATCASCHEGSVPVKSYTDSFHGIANKFGSERTAQCADCHGTHNILGPDDQNSMVAKANVPETCATCHKIAQPNFAVGLEHFEKKPYGEGAPMYWTLKFFTWLTIITISLLIIHIELDLYRRLREIES
ncbi:MAG: NapC/NirT family cytochrome c [Clostridia bacterium]|nr:NapC/NirT family cytochrome c [Clostridia bacterium]